MTQPKPLVLIILDGYGISFIEEGNAIIAAKQPALHRYFREYPLGAVKAASIDVGLPLGEPGNSETGHQTIGSGQVVYQPLPRINKALEEGSFDTNAAFTKALEHVKQNPAAAVHLIGIVSNGGIHGHIDHVIALARLATQAGLGDRTYIHAILDGRDVPVDSAPKFLEQLEKALQEMKGGKLATMVGGHYAMDRNTNWDRTQAAYQLWTEGKGERFPAWRDALQKAYASQTFELAPPIVLAAADTEVRSIQDGDAVILTNYRPDRIQQAAMTLTDPDFALFPLKSFSNVVAVTMTDYGAHISAAVAFPRQPIEHPIGEVISQAGLKQLRIAESEKQAHVTYFFNGGAEEPFPGEDHQIIPSIKSAEIQKTPGLSAPAITAAALKAISGATHDVIVMNYANPDMLAHTADYNATVQALELVDHEIETVAEAALQAGGAVLITSDHGHAEVIMNQLLHQKSTSHTTNPVPLLYIHANVRQQPGKKTEDIFTILSSPIGILADVAPTVLEILELPVPETMTGQSLLSSLR